MPSETVTTGLLKAADYTSDIQFIKKDTLNLIGITHLSGLQVWLAEAPGMDHQEWTHFSTDSEYSDSLRSKQNLMEIFRIYLAKMLRSESLKVRI